MDESRQPPTRFLVISDTHAISLSLSDKVPKVDVLLHCGDLTMSGTIEEHLHTIALLSNIQAELKLVIAGNHDLTLDEELCQRHDAQHQYRQALEIWTGPQARDNGIVYLTEGVHDITVPNTGASFSIYASPYTPRHGGGWAFQHEPEEDRYGVATPSHETTSRKVDIVMTHGPPAYILDETNKGDNAGCTHLLRFLRQTRPLLHCFGHIHEGYGAQLVEWQDHLKTNEYGVEALPKQWVGANQMRRNGYIRANAGGLQKGTRTLEINAAVLTAENEPMNVPWYVELDLAS